MARDNRIVSQLTQMQTLQSQLETLSQASPRGRTEVSSHKSKTRELESQLKGLVSNMNKDFMTGKGTQIDKVNLPGVSYTDRVDKRSTEKTASLNLFGKQLLHGGTRETFTDRQRQENGTIETEHGYDPRESSGESSATHSTTPGSVRRSP